MMPKIRIISSICVVTNLRKDVLGSSLHGYYFPDLPETDHEDHLQHDCYSHYNNSFSEVVPFDVYYIDNGKNGYYGECLEQFENESSLVGGGFGNYISSSKVDQFPDRNSGVDYIARGDRRFFSSVSETLTESDVFRKEGEFGIRQSNLDDSSTYNQNEINEFETNQASGGCIGAILPSRGYTYSSTSSSSSSGSNSSTSSSSTSSSHTIDPHYASISNSSGPKIQDKQITNPTEKEEKIDCSVIPIDTAVKMIRQQRPKDEDESLHKPKRRRQNIETPEEDCQKQRHREENEVTIEGEEEHPERGSERQDEERGSSNKENEQHTEEEEQKRKDEDEEDRKKRKDTKQKEEEEQTAEAKKKKEEEERKQQEDEKREEDVEEKNVKTRYGKSYNTATRDGGEIKCEVRNVEIQPNKDDGDIHGLYSDGDTSSKDPSRRAKIRGNDGKSSPLYRELLEDPSHAYKVPTPRVVQGCEHRDREGSPLLANAPSSSDKSPSTLVEGPDPADKNRNPVVEDPAIAADRDKDTTPFEGSLLDKDETLFPDVDNFRQTSFLKVAESLEEPIFGGTKEIPNKSGNPALVKPYSSGTIVGQEDHIDDDRVFSELLKAGYHHQELPVDDLQDRKNYTSSTHDTDDGYQITSCRCFESEKPSINLKELRSQSELESLLTPGYDGARRCGSKKGHEREINPDLTPLSSTGSSSWNPYSDPAADSGGPCSWSSSSSGNPSPRNSQRNSSEPRPAHLCTRDISSYDDICDTEGVGDHSGGVGNQKTCLQHDLEDVPLMQEENTTAVQVGLLEEISPSGVDFSDPGPGRAKFQVESTHQNINFVPASEDSSTKDSFPGGSNSYTANFIGRSIRLVKFQNAVSKFLKKLESSRAATTAREGIDHQELPVDDLQDRKNYTSSTHDTDDGYQITSCRCFESEKPSINLKELRSQSELESLLTPGYDGARRCGSKKGHEREINPDLTPLSSTGSSSWNPYSDPAADSGGPCSWSSSSSGNPSPRNSQRNSSEPRPAHLCTRDISSYDDICDTEGVGDHSGGVGNQKTCLQHDLEDVPLMQVDPAGFVSSSSSSSSSRSSHASSITTSSGASTSIAHSSDDSNITTGEKRPSTFFKRLQDLEKIRILCSEEYPDVPTEDHSTPAADVSVDEVVRLFHRMAIRKAQ